MAVKTWVGRFTVVQGQPREEGPHLRSFPRQRPDEEEDELYVLVEPASPGSEEYTGQLVDAIGRMYQQDPLSLTGAVLRALKDAHQQLLQWNQRSLREHQVGAGASCLAVRGRTAYLAQVGPAVAYYVGDGRFRRIEQEPGTTEPLGQPDGVQPLFSRYELSPGDLLLLASPRIEELVDEDALRSILLQDANQALVELFRLARDQKDFSLVLLACVVEPEKEEAAPAEAGPSAEPPEDAGPPPLEVEPELAEASAPAAEPELEVAVPPEGLSQPKVRLRGDDANIRYPSSTGLRARLPRIPPLAIVSVLLVVALGLLAWFVFLPTLQESREERFESLVTDASAALDQAGETEDPELQRSLLNDASGKLADAQDLEPDDAGVASLRAQVDTALAELNAVFEFGEELPPLELITDLSERVPGAISLGELDLGPDGAYFLDREEGRVIAVTLLASDPDPVVLLQAGDAVGNDVAGQPRHIAWAQDLGALLVLDDARRLIAVRAGEAPRLVALRDAQAWDSADDIFVSGGNLYVLDREGNQVWRYRPTEGGFDSERESVLTSADLEQAVELAVSDSVYLATEDGAIRLFQSGAAQLFPLAGIDRALVAPASLSPLSASGRLLVADRGNKRIVALSSEGVFLQQWVSPASFTDLRGIAVHEADELLYILAGGALYRTPLPPPPAAP